MKRCPRCAETVQSAAAVCRFCGHGFAQPDNWGALTDHTNRAGRWIFSTIVTLVLCWLAYACVSGAVTDQALRHAEADGQK